VSSVNSQKPKRDFALSFRWSKGGRLGNVGLELWVAKRFEGTLHVTHRVDKIVHTLSTMVTSSSQWKWSPSLTDAAQSTTLL
jgi:hypothetical protein